MAKKGISEIIATILMLMITVGLAGTAFIYIQSSLTGYTQKRISMADVSCSSGASTIYITVRNLEPDSSQGIAINPLEFVVRVDNTPATGITGSDWSPSPIPKQGNSVLTLPCSKVAGLSCATGTTHTTKVIGTNVVEGQFIC